MHHNILLFGLSRDFFLSFFILSLSSYLFRVNTNLLIVAILLAILTMEDWNGIYFSQIPFHKCIFASCLISGLEYSAAIVNASLLASSMQIALSMCFTNVNLGSNIDLPPSLVRNLAWTNYCTLFSCVETKRLTNCCYIKAFRVSRVNCVNLIYMVLRVPSFFISKIDVNECPIFDFKILEEFVKGIKIKRIQKRPTKLLYFEPALVNMPFLREAMTKTTQSSINFDLVES